MFDAGILLEYLGVGRVVYGFWLDTSKRQKKFLKLAKFELFRKKRVRPASAHSAKNAKKRVKTMKVAGQIEFECEKNNIEHKNNFPLNLQRLDVLTRELEICYFAVNNCSFTRTRDQFFSLLFFEPFPSKKKAKAFYGYAKKTYFFHIRHFGCIAI